MLEAGRGSILMGEMDGGRIWVPDFSSHSEADGNRPVSTTRRSTSSVPKHLERVEDYSGYLRMVLRTWRSIKYTTVWEIELGSRGQWWRAASRISLLTGHWRLSERFEDRSLRVLEPER